MTDVIENFSLKGRRSEVGEETLALLRQIKQLRAAAARLEADRLRLETCLVQQFDEFHHRQAKLEARIAQLEDERRKYLEDYLEVEQQNANLANLFVASHRLHSTLSRADVLTGIEEIIVNLVGSEELAIIEVDEATRHLRLSASFGIPAGTYEDLPESARVRIAACLASREIWVRNGPGTDESLTACIPLAVDGNVRGAIIIFRLLQQKVEVEPVDHELFGVLATHAAAALYCTSLHAARSQVM